MLVLQRQSLTKCLVAFGVGRVAEKSSAKLHRMKNGSWTSRRSKRSVTFVHNQLVGYKRCAMLHLCRSEFIQKDRKSVLLQRREKIECNTFFPSTTTIAGISFILLPTMKTQWWGSGQWVRSSSWQRRGKSVQIKVGPPCAQVHSVFIILPPAVFQARQNGLFQHGKVPFRSWSQHPMWHPLSCLCTTFMVTTTVGCYAHSTADCVYTGLHEVCLDKDLRFQQCDWQHFGQTNGRRAKWTFPKWGCYFMFLQSCSPHRVLHFKFFKVNMKHFVQHLSQNRTSSEILDLQNRTIFFPLSDHLQRQHLLRQDCFWWQVCGGQPMPRAMYGGRMPFGHSVTVPRWPGRSSNHPAVTTCKSVTKGQPCHPLLCVSK